MNRKQYSQHEYASSFSAYEHMENIFKYYIVEIFTSFLLTPKRNILLFYLIRKRLLLKGNLIIIFLSNNEYIPLTVEKGFRLCLEMDGCSHSPAETSDLCRPVLWRVKWSQLLLICSSSFCGLGLSCTESRSPSGFQVLNWKRTVNSPVGAVTDGSDRKLLLELRKVQATSWGGEHEKVTLPCRKKRGERFTWISSNVPAEDKGCKFHVKTITFF